VKRGYNHAEAISYLGVSRRTFEALWRPHLNPIRCGTSLIFDKAELDRVFDGFKTGDLPDGTEAAHNAGLNGWPMNEKGVFPWAERRRASSPSKTEPGRSIRYGAVADFDSVASSVMKKRRSG